jgi:hypothetical protein
MFRFGPLAYALSSIILMLLCGLLIDNSGMTAIDCCRRSIIALPHTSMRQHGENDAIEIGFVMGGSHPLP